MNEKFFDLKREKQDRIMGAAIKFFALYGYENASTDDMVREAHISKGLLFHYFISKKGLYGFIYDYCVRFIGMEFAATISTEEMNFFELREKIFAAWMDAMKQYPYIRLFLLRVEKEEHHEAIDAVGEKRRDFRSKMDDLLAFHTKWEYTSLKDFETIKLMLDCTERGLLLELDKNKDDWQETYSASVNRSIKFLKAISGISEALNRDEI